MQTLNGFIKVHRKLVQWGWYQDYVVKDLFLHLLLTASFKDSEWMGRTIRRGQLVTSYGNLANTLGFSVQQIRTAINKLKSTGEITTESTNRFTIITVENWEKYQVFELDETNETTSSPTNKQQTDNKQTTNKQQHRKKEKNVKNDKNVKNENMVDSKPSTARFTPPTLDEVREYCVERDNKVDPERFIDYYTANGWKVGKNSMKDWKATVRNWEKQDAERKNEQRGVQQQGASNQKKNRFINYTQSEHDFDEIERMERELRDRDYQNLIEDAEESEA